MSKTTSEIDAAHNYYAWQKGWIDGAGFRGIDKKFADHETLGFLYMEAWEAGREAYRLSMISASERFGYTPSVLRLAGMTAKPRDLPSEMK